MTKKLLLLLTLLITGIGMSWAEVKTYTWDFTNNDTWKNASIATGSDVTLSPTAAEPTTGEYGVTFHFTAADEATSTVAGAQFKKDYRYSASSSGATATGLFYFKSDVTYVSKTWTLANPTTDYISIKVPSKFGVYFTTLSSSTGSRYFLYTTDDWTTKYTSINTTSYFYNSTDAEVTLKIYAYQASTTGVSYVGITNITLKDYTNASTYTSKVDQVATINGVKTILATKDYTGLIEEQPYTVSTNKALVKDGKYYEQENSSAMSDFSKTYTMGNADETKEINFVLAEDIEYYAEGEDLGSSKQDSTSIISSAGQYTYYYSGLKETSALTGGSYKLEYITRGRAGNAATSVYKSDGTTSLYNVEKSKYSDNILNTSTAFTVDANATVKIGGGTGNSASYDYLLIRKVGGYIATFKESHGEIPTVTIYSDEAHTTAVNNDSLAKSTTYYYTAKDSSKYKDYSGSFTVNNADITVNYTMPGYTATFTETAGLTTTQKIYSDEVRTTEVQNGDLANGNTYYYVASLSGYADITGSLTVNGSDPSVSFTMGKLLFNVVGKTDKKEYDVTPGPEAQTIDMTDYGTYSIDGTSLEVTVPATSESLNAQKIYDATNKFCIAAKQDVLYYTLNLAKPLAAGDVINFSAYSTGAQDSKLLGLRFSSVSTFDTGKIYSSSTTSTASIWTSLSYTVGATDDLVGKKTVYITRYGTIGTYFDNMAITRPSANKFTVSFNAGEHGTYDGESLTEEAPAEGVTLPEVTANSGYSFLGWATTADATTANAGAAGATYYPYANNTLYAVYKPINISFDANGHGTKPDDISASATTTLPTLTETGYLNTGWIADQDVTVSGVTVTKGISIDCGTEVTLSTSTTFTAQWKEYYSYTVGAYDNSDETETVVQTITSGGGDKDATISFAYPAYINIDRTLYSRGVTDKSYNDKFTLTSDAQVHKIPYTITSNTNVVYFSEGEDIKGFTKKDNDDLNINIRSSQSATGYVLEATKFTTLSAGAYKITARLVGKNRNARLFYKNSDTANDTTMVLFWIGDGGNGTVVSNTFTLSESKDIYMDNCEVLSANNFMSLDYVYIQSRAIQPAPTQDNPTITIEEGSSVTTDEAQTAVTTALSNNNVEKCVNDIESHATVPSTATSAYIKAELPKATVNSSKVVTGMTFDVKPVYVESGSTTETEITEIQSPITFRLPVDGNATLGYAKVSHKADGATAATSIGTYAVKGDATDGKYIEVSAKEFSEYSYELTDDAPVASVTLSDGTTTNYSTFETALSAATADGVATTEATKATITLLADVSVAGFSAPANHYVAIEGGSYTMTLTAPVEVRGDLIISSGIFKASTGTYSNGFFDVTGTLTVNDGTIDASAVAAHAIYTGSNKGNAANGTGSGNLTVTGGTIKGSADTESYYAIYVNNTNTDRVTSLSGGEFYGNSGAIYLPTGFAVGSLLASDKCYKQSSNGTWAVYTSGYLNSNTIATAVKVDSYLGGSMFQFNVANGSFGTVCLPYNATVEGATILNMLDISSDGKIVVGKSVSTTLKAGVPYLFKATENTQTFTEESGGVYAVATTTGGLTGNYSTSTKDASYFYLSNNTFTNGVSTGNADPFTCYITYSLPNTSYGIEFSNDVIITESNTEATAITGEIAGDIIIKMNTESARGMTVYFNKVQLTGEWNHSLIISNTLEPITQSLDQIYPTVNLIFSGACAFVNNTAAGIIINPTAYENTNYVQKSCKISFGTLGESTIYAGSNIEGKYAIEDQGGTSARSAILYDSSNDRFDNIQYSEQYNVTEQTLSWTDYSLGTETFDSFISDCKAKFHFVHFTQNNTIESRQMSGLWGTCAWPHDMTITNADLYDLVGTVWDETVSPKKLTSLVVKKSSDSHPVAGRAYIFKKHSLSEQAQFSLITSTESTYTAATACNGLIGSYVTSAMPAESVFLSGQYIYRVKEGRTNNVKYYRAYIPNISAVEDKTSAGAKAAIEGGLRIIDDEATEIVDVKAFGDIFSNNVYYDLMGRRVQTPVKGSIYIVNGKKVVF